MPTTTPILGLKKPVVGADDDLWGGMLNGNMDIIDGLVRPVDLGPYLLKSGGTMTGALALAADANLALQPVSLQQMNAALALKPGEAPVDGRWYARRNNAWDVAPGSAINVDAPSDGFVYGRLNAGWSKALPLAGGTLTGPVVLAGDATAPLNPVSLQQLNTTAGAYLPLTGGIVTGPTTIMGAAFTAKKNLMLGVPEPATLSAATAADGGVLRAWYTIANNYMTGMYWDGTNNRRLNATGTPGQIALYQGAYSFSSGATGAADSIPTMTTLATMTANGSFGTTSGPPGDMTGGSISANGGLLVGNWVGWNMYNGAGGWRTRVTGPSALLYSDTAAANMQLYIAASVAAGAVATITQVANFGIGGTTLFGDIVATGSVWAANLGGSFGLQNFGGGWWGLRLNSPGWRIQWDSNSGNLQFVNDAGSARFTSYASGVFLTAGYIQAGGVDGNGYAFTSGAGGVWVNGQIYAATNVIAANTVQGGYIHSTGAVDGTYLHSTGDVRADSWVYGNRIVSTTGYFQIAEGYRLERQSWDGTWVFFENNTWNFQVRTNGDVNARSVVYADGHIFSRNNVYMSNDWNFFIGAGASGRVFAFASNWYLQWNSSNGDMDWVGNGVGLFRQRASDFLVWNQNGPVGGIGGYQNYSDRRVKEDIQPAKEGLAEILKLEPVEFIRVYDQKLLTGRKFPDGRDMPDYIPRREIGFIAQDVAPVLPQAVHIMGQPLPDGTGELYGPDPTLSLTYDTITTALVNAVKTLNARLAALEATA